LMPQAPAPGQGNYTRILAVKLADLGDLLTITPALQALRATYPASDIDLLVPPSSASLLAGAPYVNRILAFNKFAFDRKSGLLNLEQLLRASIFFARLRVAGYDALMLFHHFTTRWGTLKFAALALASGAPARAGLDNGRGRFL